MTHSTDPFGSFKHDKPRLEAVRLREQRRLWLGLAFCASTVLVLLFGDPSVAVLTGLGAIVQALMR
jgi:hypothetical protein